MQPNYLQAAHKLRLTHTELQKILKYTPCGTFEDHKALTALERITGEIEAALSTIRHYAKPCTEGYLVELPNGRFTLEGTELTCGCSLEVYSQEEDEWYSGRVEYSDKYYFYCRNLRNPKLFEGMGARIRTG